MLKLLIALLVAILLGLFIACEQPPELLSPSPSPVESTPAPVERTPAPTVAPIPSPTPVTYSVEDYLPFEDVHIRYDESVTQTTIDSYVEYYNVEKQVLQRKTLDDKSALLEVLQIRDGVLSCVLTLSDLFYMHNFTDRIGETSEILIAEPIVVGNQWPVPGGTREITALEKHMPVPIGSYAALEITTNFNNGARQVQYYMKNVGLVADYYFDPNGVMLRKMEARMRERGAAQTQNMNFYFADPANNCVSFVTRGIDLPANVNMRDKIANELRNVPGSTPLIPFSPSVRILSIRPDLKNSVTVDFSRHLVEEMTLEGRGERLLLTAIANTFGDYFGVSRVYILVEGEEYISPNIMLLPGEYLTPDIRHARRV